MTDLPDDELVSAVLDDEATDEEVARVHGDATLSARLAELRFARDAIATPISSPSAAQRDAAIATAVSSLPEATPKVVALHDRRRRRILQLASIAAALLIVVGIVSAIAVLSNHGGSKAGSTTAAGPAQSSPAEVTTPAPASPSTTTSFGADEAKAAAGGPATGSATDLGSFQTAQQLADAAKAKAFSASRPPLNESTVSPPAPAVSAPAVSCESRPDATLVARAELAGRPVIVIVTSNGGKQTLEVYGLDCTLLLTQPL